MMARAQAAYQTALDWARAHPSIASATLGVIAALGYAPVHAWWVAVPALAGFVALLYDAPSARSAALRGWVFGWAHLTLANNWIATAFTYQAKMPEYLGWVAVPLLCIYLALYPALAALVTHMLARRAPPVAFMTVLAGAWIFFEWARGWVFTGYPWPPLGMILLGSWKAPGVAQFLPWLGTYALSGLMILIAASFWIEIRQRRELLLLGSGAVFAFVMIWPVYSQGDESDIGYTLVQPFIPQDEINDGSKFEEQFERIVALTNQGPDAGQPRLVLWPESAIPDYLEPGYPQRYYNQVTAVNLFTGQGDPDFARRRIGLAIGQGSTLLTGVVNLDIGVVDGYRRATSARNSVVALDSEGALTHHYAKAHLVPYGEYLPMRSILKPLGLSRLVAGSIDYRSGPGPRSLDLGEYGKAGVQICYEIVFSGQVIDRDDRPDYLFNPSNDGWFGSWGPPQHLAQARLRALEEGLPVLRATTTGISAVIDANGVVRQSVPRGQAAALHGRVPKAHAPTLFARFGNALGLVWAGLLILFGVVYSRSLALRAGRS